MLYTYFNSMSANYAAPTASRGRIEGAALHCARGVAQRSAAGGWQPSRWPVPKRTPAAATARTACSVEKQVVKLVQLPGKRQFQLHVRARAPRPAPTAPRPAS